LSVLWCSFPKKTTDRMKMGTPLRKTAEAQMKKVVAPGA